MEEQVVSIWLGTTGRLDPIPVGDVRRFEREFLDHLRRSDKVLQTIRETGKLEDDTRKALEDELDQWAKGFDSSEDTGPVQAGHEEAEALEDSDVEQEKIVRQKRG
jgi:F-type H+-transporting ATPase subunit alpha